jgi:hypothetical protein
LDFFSTDPERPGVIAVGQLAYGVFALGQLATGVVAVGQLARGVIAVGQGAVGVVALGQGAISLGYGVAMMGVVGRGLGFVVPVLPRIRIERPKVPEVSPVAELEALVPDDPAGAWVPVEVVDGKLRYRGEDLVADMTPIEASLDSASQKDHTRAFVRLSSRTEVVGSGKGYRQPAQTREAYEAHSLRSYSDRTRIRLEGPLTDPLGLVVRLLGFVALAAAWWFLAGRDVAALFGWAEPFLSHGG